jgi:hypothetical protein
MYDAGALSLNMHNSGDDSNHQRYGLNRGAGKNII